MILLSSRRQNLWDNKLKLVLLTEIYANAKSSLRQVFSVLLAGVGRCFKDVSTNYVRLYSICVWRLERPCVYDV